MTRYLYLTLTPEALISSMLPPTDFGNYLAVGTRKRTRGQAIFFEIDEAAIKDQLPMEYIEKRCVPNADGGPKRSVYLSIYRALESIPLKAYKSLFLTTDDGRVLELKQGSYSTSGEQKLHLYQELCPATPRVASSLAAPDFLLHLTRDREQVRLPKLVFVELALNDFATKPETAVMDELPYDNVEHLRDCLIDIKQTNGKTTKTVIRFYNRDIFFRTIKNGFFVGDAQEMLYYPFPSPEQLEGEYYAWWRSAKAIGF